MDNTYEGTQATSQQSAIKRASVKLQPSQHEPSRHVEDSSESSLSVRRQHLGPNTALFFEDPEIVRGEGTYLFDTEGNTYLDCINNVAHVGHCHPTVAAAVSQQLHTLNTNSRYMHPTLPRYLKALTATFPDPLKVVYMVNSGSEANDLALRIMGVARPGRTHIAVMAGAYHGHTLSLIPLSSYKFWGPGGEGKEPNIHIIPCPDPYRKQHCDGRKAARAVLEAARLSGGRIGAFFCESVLSCGGQVFLPEGYLKAVYDEMQSEGVICIADEVQSGFGRSGEAFWAFQSQGVVPDAVSIGKAMGNGFPVAALITNRDLATKFDNGMEYFNTFGGCTAAATAALAVLETVQKENLQSNAAKVGAYLLQRLQEVQQQHPLLGDVRGRGLMIGIEVVRSLQCKRPAPCTAAWIKRRMFQRRVLLSTDGPYNNVIKMKPPMVFSISDADLMLQQFRDLLDTELTASKAADLEAEEKLHEPQLYRLMALHDRSAASLHLAAL